MALTAPLMVRVSNGLDSECRTTITLDGDPAKSLRELLRNELGPMTLDEGLPDCHRRIVVTLDVQQITMADPEAMLAEVERTLDSLSSDQCKNRAAQNAASAAVATLSKQSQLDANLCERLRFFCQNLFWAFPHEPKLVLGRMFGLKCSEPLQSLQKLADAWLEDCYEAGWFYNAAAVELVQRLQVELPDDLSAKLAECPMDPFVVPDTYSWFLRSLLFSQLRTLLGHKSWLELEQELHHAQRWMAPANDQQFDYWPREQSLALLAEQLERCQKLVTEHRQLETTVPAQATDEQAFNGTTAGTTAGSSDDTTLPTAGADEIALGAASSAAPDSDQLAEEQRDLRQALRISMQDVGVLRHAPRVRKWRLVGCQADTMLALAESEHLRSAVKAVETAGCEVMPAWANGALMLVPTTEEQAKEELWQPEFFHILVRDEDLGSLINALHGFPRGGPHRSKPALRPEEDEPIGTVCYLDLDEKVRRWLGNSQWKLQEDRTFVNVLPASGGSSKARSQSAEGRFSSARSFEDSELHANAVRDKKFK